MTVSQEELLAMHPEKLAQAYDRLRLIGMVLGQLALLEIITDPDAGATAKAQAARTLTSLIDDPKMVADALEHSPLAGKSPEELRELIDKLKQDEITLEDI